MTYRKLRIFNNCLLFVLSAGMAAMPLSVSATPAEVGETPTAEEGQSQSGETSDPGGQTEGGTGTVVEEQPRDRDAIERTIESNQTRIDSLLEEVNVYDEKKSCLLEDLAEKDRQKLICLAAVMAGEDAVEIKKAEKEQAQRRLKKATARRREAQKNFNGGDKSFASAIEYRASISEYLSAQKAVRIRTAELRTLEREQKALQKEMEQAEMDEDSSGSSDEEGTAKGKQDAVKASSYKNEESGEGGRTVSSESTDNDPSHSESSDKGKRSAKSESFQLENIERTSEQSVSLGTRISLKSPPEMTWDPNAQQPADSPDADGEDGVNPQVQAESAEVSGEAEQYPQAQVGDAELVGEEGADPQVQAVNTEAGGEEETNRPATEAADTEADPDSQVAEDKQDYVELTDSEFKKRAREYYLAADRQNRVIENVQSLQNEVERDQAEIEALDRAEKEQEAEESERMEQTESMQSALQSGLSSSSNGNASSGSTYNPYSLYGNQYNGWGLYGDSGSNGLISSLYSSLFGTANASQNLYSGTYGTPYTNYSSNPYTLYGSMDSSAAMGQAVANYALQFVGRPYVWGGTSLTNGCDCSGFVQQVFKQFGVNLSRTTYTQYKEGTEVSYYAMQPGDVINYGSHTAIYIGNNKIVHAANEDEGIIVSDNPAYKPILTIRRYV